MIRLSGPLLEKYNSNSPIAQAINSVTKRLSQKDSTIWGDAAKAEASVRLKGRFTEILQRFNRKIG